MATYLADRVIVFEGTPAIDATATPYVFRSRLVSVSNIMVDRKHYSLA